jgi:hypothetical protein
MFLLFAFSTLPLSGQTSPKNMLPPLAPAYGQMQPTFWERYGIATVIYGVAFIAWLGFIYWLFFRPQPPLVAPPEVEACETLMKLSRQPEDGKVLGEISQTLRRYVIAAFSFPSGERTTAEFTVTLAGDKKFDANLAQSISNLLRECDQRKFSPKNSGAPLNAASRALEIISEAEKKRQAPQIP